MTDNTSQRPPQAGHYGSRPDDHYPPPPPPPPPPCPDPCEDPPWGPPKIHPECCPDDRECCPPEARGGCLWDEVDDPCVRAASADCGGEWTKITCRCESSNHNCSCEEWECGGYPCGTCVPCQPCEGLIPPDEPSPEDCQDPERDDCDSDQLRRQLEALQKCISSQEGEQAKIAAEIAARKARATALSHLIQGFDSIVEDYKTKRHQLTSREDALKGFARDIARVFQDRYRFPEECLQELHTAINATLCELEKAKCCQKHLEGKLGTDSAGQVTRFTRIIWEQQQAARQLDKANTAFTNLKTFATWIDDRFKPLEALKEQIATLLNSLDPQDHNVAFYRFYWEFVPALCKRFPVAICCKGEEHGGQTQYQSTGQPAAPPQPQSQQLPPYAQQGQQPTQYHPPEHIGCEPGDWHPSRITVEELKQLICCAWDYVRTNEEQLAEKTDAVARATRNLGLIKAKVDADSGTLDARIVSRVKKVKCTRCGSSR